MARRKLENIQRQTRSTEAADLERWRHDPVAFAREALGVEPWATQAAILAAVAAHHRVAVRSGHKVGKTNCLAILALWWACCWPLGKVLVTAPSQPQIKDLFWAEVRALAIKARSIGRVHIPEVALDPSTGIVWEDGRRIIGRSTDKPERIQGYSGPACLYLIDEASGVDETIYRALRGNTAGGSAEDESAIAKFVLTGNPTQTSGFFFDAFHDHAAEWESFCISSADTPNALTGSVVVPGLATRDFVETIARQEGIDSDEYRVRVLGDFPRKGGSQVNALEVVEAAVQRYADTPGVGRLELGVDVARFGDDETAIATRRGQRMFPLRCYRGLAEPDVAAKVLEAARDPDIYRKGERRPLVKVDTSNGMGVAVASLLRLARDAGGDPIVDVIEVSAAESSDDPGRFRNIRSQLWFGGADWLKGGGAIPNDKMLRADLLAPKYGYDVQQRREVEPKDAFKKRLGRSPDRGDAFNLAVYSPAHVNTVSVEVPSDGDYRWDESRGYG